MQIHKPLASVLEEYSHDAYLFKEELEEEVRKMEFAFNKRTQILLATIIKENRKRITINRIHSGGVGALVSPNVSGILISVLGTGT